MAIEKEEEEEEGGEGEGEGETQKARDSSHLDLAQSVLSWGVEELVRLLQPCPSVLDLRMGRPPPQFESTPNKKLNRFLTVS